MLHVIGSSRHKLLTDTIPTYNQFFGKQLGVYWAWEHGLFQEKTYFSYLKWNWILNQNVCVRPILLLNQGRVQDNWKGGLRSEEGVWGPLADFV